MSILLCRTQSARRRGFSPIPCLSLFFPVGAEGGFSVADWIKMCITINFPIELVCATILTPILAVAVKKATERFM